MFFLRNHGKNAYSFVFWKSWLKRFVENIKKKDEELFKKVLHLLSKTL